METASFGSGLEGRVVEGQFPLLERLEGSGNSVSFLTLLQGSKEAVIQLISPDGAEADAYVAQWEFAKVLSHPHLTRVFEAGRCVINGSDLVYVVTERSHATLSKIVQKRALTADSVREMFRPVLKALSYLHQNGVVHGYINPTTILLADLEPKLSAANLLKAGSATRSIPGSGDYDAPELRHGGITGAADIWSIGMTLWEAMTQSLPRWDMSTNPEPIVKESLPSPIREIVQDCLRVDPLRRCAISDILERLGETKTVGETKAVEDAKALADTKAVEETKAVADTKAVAETESVVETKSVGKTKFVGKVKSVPLSDEPIPVKKDQPARAKAPISASKAPINDKPERFVFADEEFEDEDEFEDEEYPESPLFSRSISHLEETHHSRWWVIPVVLLLLGVIAFFSIRSFRERVSKIASALENQNAPARSEPVPQDQSAVPAPPVANPTESAKTEPEPKPQPETTPQAETQTPPAVAEPLPEPPPAPVQVPVAQPNASGLVAKQVLPTISPGARNGIRGTVEVAIRVSVNTDGAVSNAAYVSPGPGNYFARLAQRAALSWEFTPPRRNGNPERSVWMLRFHFTRETTEADATEESASRQ